LCAYLADNLTVISFFLPAFFQVSLVLDIAGVKKAAMAALGRDIV
jgi:hypothetical protein